MSTPYKSNLVNLMSFLDGITYQKNQEFSTQELARVTDDGIVRYFTHWVFGTVNPTPSDRAKIRANTLQFAKKAISLYMPRAH